MIATPTTTTTIPTSRSSPHLYNFNTLPCAAFIIQPTIASEHRDISYSLANDDASLPRDSTFLIYTLHTFTLGDQHYEKKLRVSIVYLRPITILLFLRISLFQENKQLPLSILNHYVDYFDSLFKITFPNDAF